DKDPVAWSAVGNSGGQASAAGTTTVWAICLDDPQLHTTVVQSVAVDHPVGPGNTNAGSDPVAVVTASCTGDSTLLDGGSFATGNSTGQDPIVFGAINNPQQGVHLRGSFPSAADGTPVADGAKTQSWSTIAQSGGQATPGTDTYAWALCGVQAAAAPSA